MNGRADRYICSGNPFLDVLCATAWVTWVSDVQKAASFVRESIGRGLSVLCVEWRQCLIETWIYLNPNITHVCKDNSIYISQFDFNSVYVVFSKNWIIYQIFALNLLFLWSVKTHQNPIVDKTRHSDIYLQSQQHHTILSRIYPALRLFLFSFFFVF